MNPFQIFLLIFSGLVLLFGMLFFLPVRLCCRYDGKPALAIKILCFTYPLYPKEKRWRMKDHLPEYQKKKKAKKQKQSTQPTEKGKDEKSGEEKIRDLFSFVSRLLDRVILPLLERLGRHLTVRISRLEIVIGSSDAAKSALLYGTAVNMGYALLAFLDEHLTLKKKRNAAVSVVCPFTKECTSALCELELSCPVYGLLFIVLPALYTYITEFTDSAPATHKV